MDTRESQSWTFEELFGAGDEHDEVCLDKPLPPDAGASAWFGSNISQEGLHPTAAELASGLAAAARNNRVKAWRGQVHDHNFAPSQQPDGSYLTCCPAHDDHNPSLVVTDRADEDGDPKLLVYCRSGCPQSKVIEALEELGLWSVPPGTIPVSASLQEPNAAHAKAPTQKKGAPLVPVPASAPPPPSTHFQLGPPTLRWAYRNGAGELIFYVYRFDPNPTCEANYAQAPKGKVETPGHKTFRPLSYCEYEHGTERWSWTAPSSGIPLYNEHELPANPDAKVIVCEGEKAADAAALLFPDDVAVTWYSGAKAVAKAPWSVLKARDIKIWADHDGAGAAAAKTLVNELRAVGCASIVVIDVMALASVDPTSPDGPNRAPPAKWDAADALAEWSDRDRLRAEVDRHSSPLEARQQIEISPDNIGETVDKAERVLLDRSLPIFKRGGLIVRVGQYVEKSANGQTQSALVAQQLYPAALSEALESSIRFEQYDARKKATKPVHAPDLLVKTFLERGKLSGLRPLTGLTDIPLVRDGGDLLDVPGYDEVTGIYYQPSGLALDIPENPTLDDAQQAIASLKQLIRDFPFKSTVDEAAAISAFISAVNRPALGATPMHALTAPTPGSGKSLLATLITIVATGGLPSYITQGQDDEELEKRVSSQMLAGKSVINIDNCDRPLKGAALCNLLTAESVSLRILGRSEAPDITSSSFILTNGNNMRFADDMVRRTVVCQIDPKMERPEERAIGWDAKAEARKNRGKYVSDCLTILLAYQAAGAPKQTTPLGSFEDWSRRVRDAIIWAGFPDPCGNADKLRDADPEKERFMSVAEQWHKRFADEWRKVAAVIKEAASNEELGTALMTVAGVGRDINANRLGSYLSRYADRPISGFKFVSRKGGGGTKQWRLEKV